MVLEILLVPPNVHSDLLYVGPEDDIYRECVLCARLDVTAGELALPDGLNPLANALQCANILQQGVNAWRFESELNDNLLSTVDSTLGVITLEVWVLALL